MSKFESFPIVKTFRNALQSLPDADSMSVVCGVSGGVDSMTLLYLLHRFGVDCTVAHCNYQLRGKDSDKEMELVEEVAAMWGFECISVRFDPSEKGTTNTQLWARDLRYTMFRDLKNELQADYIVTAHHREDQIETILLKILRGSGPGTWSGMNTCDGELFRPLLKVSKEEIVAFAADQHVPFLDDKSNQTSAYARNLIRNDLAPELDALIPGWKENVLRIPEIAVQFLDMVDILLGQMKIGSKALERHELLKLPETLWPALIHRFIEKEATHTAGHVTIGELKQTNKLPELQTGGFLEFGKDIRLVRDRNQFTLQTDMPAEKKAVELSDDELPFHSTSYGIAIDTTRWDGRIDQCILQIDSEHLQWPLTLRPWRDGDKIQPLGMSGHKLVSDVLTDAKVSTIQKKEAFLAESFDGIICAIIFPAVDSGQSIGVISENYRCTESTSHILRIERSK